MLPAPADPDRATPGARRRRVLRGAAALLALVWLGGPNWPEQIDDQLITLAFAHEWAEAGLIRWGTGEVVEGCSSFLQLALATGWIALGLPDANVFVKALAALSGVGLVLYANARLPLAAAGTLLLAALVAWEPTARWSFVGMETTLYALLLTVGWTGLFVAWPGPVAGLGALWLAATAHPEGNLHFAVGALFALACPGRPRAAALGLGAALAGYHLLRASAYGAWLPTPYLVKVAANDGFGEQWGQFGWEAVTLAGVGATLLTGYAPRARALLPFAIQAAVELRAESDWMGHARHLLPGVWASAVLWASLAPPRPLRARHLGVVALVLGISLLEPPNPPVQRPALRDRRVVTAPDHWLATSLDTTQLEDVVHIVAEAPAGAAVVIEDVGMPGNVPDVRVIDLVGLTDRQIALASTGDEAAQAAVERRFQGPPDRPALVRRMVYAEGEMPRPVPGIRLPAPQHLVYPQGTALWYRLTDARPTPEVVASRWRELHARYPAQGPLAWYHAMTEAEQGRLLGAAAVADAATRRYPYDPLLASLHAALFSPFPLEDFDEPPIALRQTSRPLSRADAAGLVLLVGVDPTDDAGQLVRVGWSCGGPSDTVLTQGTVRAHLPPWRCDEDTARLRVEAVDARPRHLLPRSLYVGFGRAD